jgi:choline dehydrogenase-like flavoprotein
MGKKKKGHNNRKEEVCLRFIDGRAHNECYENRMKRQCSGRQMGRRNERLDVLTGREPAEEMRHSRGQALGGGSKSTLMLNSSHFGRKKKDTLEGEKKSGKAEKYPTPLQSLSCYFLMDGIYLTESRVSLFSSSFYPRE